MEVLSQKKSWGSVLACGLLALAAGSALAASDNSKQQGGNNGQPFFDLNAAIQAEIDAVEAELQNEAACINDYLNGTTNAAGPCPDYSNSIVEQLEEELDMLQSDVSDLEDVVDGAECPAGYSIRSVDPLICEFDSTIDDRLHRRRVIGLPSVAVRFNRFGTAVATCPTGYLATGCGFVPGNSARPVLTVYSNFSVRPNQCRTSAFHGNFTFRASSPSIRAVAECTKAIPGN